MADAKRGDKNPKYWLGKKCPHMTGENHPFYGKHHAPETRKKMSEARLGKRHPFTKEATEKMRALMTGANNPRWKGGVTSENRNLRCIKRWKHWQEDVFRRDNYTCQSCGVRGGELNPHHILFFADFPDHRFYVGNGVTLCRKHHYMLHVGSRMESQMRSLEPYRAMYFSAFEKEN